MELSLETIITNCTDLSFVKKCLFELMDYERNFQIIPSLCKYVERENGIQILLNEDNIGYDDLAEQLSKKLSAYVMLLHIDSENCWGYYLYDKGEKIDGFDPDSQFLYETIRENSRLTYEYGDAKKISKYFGVPKERIEKYLVQWVDKHYENEIFAYETDKYPYTSPWQMYDFMDTIGFPFEWDLKEEGRLIDNGKNYFCRK